MLQLRGRRFVTVAMLIGSTIALFAPRRGAVAQAPDATSAIVFRDAFLMDMDAVHTKIVALANAIPAEKYDWRPSPEVRTVSNALMHVAMEWYFGIPVATGGKPPAEWPSFAEAGKTLLAVTAKKDVLEHLDKAWTYGRAQAAAATAEQLLAVKFPITQPPAPFPRASYLMAGDLHEHLGQLITYARSIGVKPPWSK